MGIAIRAGAADGHDVWMVQQGTQPRLVGKQSPSQIAVRTCELFPVEDLEGHLCAGIWVSRQVHGSHVASPEQF
jgi:hypothetical protein